MLAGRQQQLELKMQKNREAQEESLRRREELIQELELEREIRCRERKQEEGCRTARMQEIDAQVSTLCSVLGFNSSFFLVTPMLIILTLKKPSPSF